jgi:hypothetical protein
MLQEIITYMIIGSAVTLALLKIVKRFSRKKPGNKATKSGAAVHEHNCGECAAECQLRDLPRMVIEKNIDKCIPVEKKSKLLQP